MTTKAPKTPAYLVKKGDCLWKIAQDQYGDPAVWKEIAHTNNLMVPYTVLIGQKLRLAPVKATPSAGSSPTPFPTRPASAPVGTPAPAIGRPASLIAPLEAMRAAKPVAYPALKYKLQDFSPVVRVTPEMTYTLQLKGDLTLQRKGVIAEAELSNEGLTRKLKAEVESELSKLTANAEFKEPLAGKPLELKCELAVSAKVKGQVFLTQKVAVIPLSTIRYTMEAQPVAGEHGGFAFKGTYGFQLDITRNNRVSLSPQLVPSPVPGANARWIAIGLMVAAGALVVGTLVEDIVFPPGLADDPVSFAAAAAMMRGALQAM